jgi:hypothetical protein
MIPEALSTDAPSIIVLGLCDSGRSVDYLIDSAEAEFRKLCGGRGNIECAGPRDLDFDQQLVG